MADNKITTDVLLHLDAEPAAREMVRAMGLVGKSYNVLSATLDPLLDKNLKLAGLLEKAAKAAGSLEKTFKGVGLNEARAGRGAVGNTALGGDLQRLNRLSGGTAPQLAAAVKERVRLSKELAGAVLEMEARMRELDAQSAKLSRRNPGSRRVKEIEAEKDALAAGIIELRKNADIRAQLVKATSEASQKALRQLASDLSQERAATTALIASKQRLFEIQTKLATSKPNSAQTQALNLEKANLEALIASYEKVGSAKAKAASGFGPALSGGLSRSGAETSRMAKQYLASEERVAEINARINQHQTTKNKLNRDELASLAQELAYNQMNLSMGAQDVKLQEAIARLRAKRADAARELAQKEKSALNSRMQGDAALDMAADRRRAKHDQAEVDRHNRHTRMAAKEDDQDRTNIANRMRRFAEMDHDEFKRQERKRRADEREANRKYTRDFNRAYQEGHADNRYIDQAPRRLAAAARTGYNNEIMIAKNLEAINRLREAGAWINKKDIASLERANVELQKEINALKHIVGYEERVHTLRVRNAKAERAPPPPRRPSVQARAELVGDYVTLGALAGTAMAMGNYVVQYEKSMAQFQAISASTTIETLRVSDAIQNLGMNTRFTNLEIAKTATLLAQAGLSSQDTEAALSSVARLATAAGVELSQAGDVVTSIGTIFQYTSSQFDTVADVVTSALNRTKLTMDQLQLGIQYAANTAQEAGVSFVELTSAMGAMAQAGIRSGSTQGTGLRALMVEFETPSKKMVENLEKVGLTLEDVDIRSLGLTKVLKNLVAAGFGTANAFETFEVRAASAFAALSGQLDTMERFESSLTATGTATIANAVQMDTLSAKWIRFTNIMSTLGNSALAPLVDTLKAILDAVSNLAARVDGTSPVIRVLTIAMVALMATLVTNKIASVVVNLFAIAPAAGAATVGVTGLRLALTLLTGPIGLVIGVMVAVIATMIQFQSKSESMVDSMERLDSSINMMSSALEDYRSNVAALENQIEKLSRAAAAAAEDEFFKDRLLRETRDRFTALGLQIDKGSNSMEEMRAALVALRAEMAKELSQALLTYADAVLAKANELAARAAGLPGGLTTPESRAAATAAIRDEQGTLGSGVISGNNIISRYRRQADLTRLNMVAQGDATMPLLDVDGKTTVHFTTAQRAVQQATALVRALQQLAVTQKNPAERARIMSDIQKITQLIGAAAVPIAAALDVGRIRQDSDVARTEAAAVVPIAAARTAMQKIWEEVNYAAKRAETMGQLERPLADRLKDVDAMIAAAKVKMANALATAEVTYGTSPYKTQIQAALETYVNERFSELGAGLDAYRATLPSSTAGDSAETRANRLEEELKASRLEVLEADLSRLEAQMKAAIERGDPAELLRLKNLWEVYAAEVEKRQREAIAAGVQTDHGSLPGLIPALAGNPAPSSGIGNRTNPNTGAVRFHAGVDFPAEQGTPILAPGAGQVMFAGNAGDGYGNKVVIKLAEGLEVLLAHMDTIAAGLAAGQTVAQGQVVGGVGNTGESRGNHLHEEYTLNGEKKTRQQLLANPQVAELLGNSLAAGAADMAARRASMETMVTEGMNKMSLDTLKAEIENNKADIKSAIDTMADLSGSPEMLDVSMQRILGMAETMINQARQQGALEGDNPAKLRERVAEAIREASAVETEAWGALVEAYATAAQERVDAAQQNLANANSQVGTSATRKWLLENAVAQETFNGALENRAIVSRALADALADLAAAEAVLAAVDRTDLDATSAAVAAVQARQTAATSEAANMRTAEQRVRATTPVRPVYQSGGTTAWNQFQDIAAHFGETSGVMIDTSQTIATGIENMFGALSGGLEQAIKDISSGSLTIKQSFSRMFQGIFEELQAMAAKIMANMIMKFILSKILSFGVGMGVDSYGGADVSSANIINSGAGGLYLGGAPSGRRFALGGANPNRDSIHALLQPGEVVMRKSAVQMVGRQNLLNINAMGNSRRSEGVASHMAKPREPDMVNIWMVPANQVPPPGPKDIIHIIGSDISSGGSIKKLIRQVAQGG